MIFESRDLHAHWCIVLVREEGVFFISGAEGFSKAEALEETEWRMMPAHGNKWWKSIT